MMFFRTWICQNLLLRTTISGAVPFLMSLVSIVNGIAIGGEPASKPRPSRLARPVAMAYLKTAHRLLVANRDSATLATVNPQTQSIEANWQVPDAASLSDLAVSDTGELVITCSSSLNRVWLLQRLEGGLFSVLDVREVPLGAVTVTWLPGEKQVAVSCQWSRTVVLLDVDPTATEGQRLKVRHPVALTHTPRRLLPVEAGQRLIVADQFSGTFSVINVPQGKLERTFNFPGQNVHGLTLTAGGRKVVIAHQILNQVAETSRDAVFWGIVMSNSLRVIPVENFLDPQRGPLSGADIHFLGEPNHGAADPTHVAVGENETILTTLGGLDELAIGIRLDHSYDRVKVGRHPIAVVTDPTGKLAYVANQFSDSISVVEIQTRKNLGEISLHGSEKPRPPDLVERGEILFHDGKLSLDGWYSCHSCHSSGHTVGLLNDNLGDGDYGAPKRIPSLLGISETGPYLWSGKQRDLHQQTRKSITTTMQGDEPTEAQIEELVAYMRSLPPPPQIPAVDTARVSRGATLFETHDCIRCHTPPTYTSPGTYEVGLEDQLGRKKFNPPSLRGVRYRGPFFHDHRAATLKEVFTTHQHPSATKWTESELADLVAFLESL